MVFVVAKMEETLLLKDTNGGLKETWPLFMGKNLTAATTTTTSASRERVWNHKTGCPSVPSASTDESKDYNYRGRREEYVMCTMGGSQQYTQDDINIGAVSHPTLHDIAP